jgi:hypothetical protein
MLARYEEMVKRDRDGHDRFPAAASTAYREEFLARPIVNEYTEILWSVMSRLWPRLRRARHQFRVDLSHDVDWPKCSNRRLAATVKAATGDLLKRRDPQLTARRLLSRAALRWRPDADICNTFTFLMDESERRGMRSAFYFIAGHTAAARDGDYSLDDPWIRQLMTRIHRRGHEIGLHPSYETFRDAQQTRREKEVLLDVCGKLGIEQEAWGGRQHFLRWENPTTWENWEQAGLDYDSTVGFADCPGFRAGVCFEYPAFSITRRSRLRLRERPLVVMEASLLDYLQRSPDETIAEICRLKRNCKLFGGRLTLLWHNSRLLTRVERRMYREALDAS